MNSKKSGTIFIVLMIALVAYGFVSVANTFDLGGSAMVNLLPSNILSFNQQQITQMNDPAFKPVYLVGQGITNTTNTTSNTTTNTNDTGNQDNSTQNNQDNSQ